MIQNSSWASNESASYIYIYHPVYPFFYLSLLFHVAWGVGNWLYGHKNTIPTSSDQAVVPMYIASFVFLLAPDVRMSLMLPPLINSPMIGWHRHEEQLGRWLIERERLWHRFERWMMNSAAHNTKRLSRRLNLFSGWAHSCVNAH